MVSPRNVDDLETVEFADVLGAIAEDQHLTRCAQVCFTGTEEDQAEQQDQGTIDEVLEDQDMEGGGDALEEADREADLLEQMPLPGHPESEKERLASWLRLPRRARVAIRRLHRSLRHLPKEALVQMLRAARAPQDYISVAKTFRCQGCDNAKPRPQTHKTHKVSPPRPYTFNHEEGVDVFEIVDWNGVVIRLAGLEAPEQNWKSGTTRCHAQEDDVESHQGHARFRLSFISEIDRRFRADRRRERDFRYPKRLQTGRSTVQPALQHGAAVCIKKCGTEWQRTKGMGIYLSDQDRDCLTNLRFADDVMLFATSKGQMQAMMCEFKEATKKVGLTIHPNKTKILSSESSMNPDTRRYMKIGDLDIEILAKSESVKYLGQRISFHQQETIEIKSRIRAAWATFHKYRQELTSKKYLLNYRLCLFDATVSPTLCYAAGTWSPSREHERMIQSTQRKMLRLIIQTKRKYKKIERKKVVEHTIEEENDDKTENCSTDDKSDEDQSTKSEDDMDSGATFDEDSEKDIDTAEIEEEDWFDYIRRSTADAIDRMDHAKIRCWNKTHKKMKWKLALRIATSPSERWVKKAAEWNPEVSSKYRTSRTIGRPKKRWEDDINDFLKQNHDETKIEETRERRIQNNNRWISIAIDRKEWTRLEEKYISQNAK